jgi:glucose-6-phosphate isomerase
MIEIHGLVQGASLDDELKELQRDISRAYETPIGALYAPSDKEAIKIIKQTAQRMKQLNPTLFLLVGIGGSAQGAQALVQALHGLYGNATKPVRFYCADTIDNDLNTALLFLVRQELEQGGKVLLCIISKSGKTVETLINGSLFLELLKALHPTDYTKYLIIITDRGSVLEEYARTCGYELLTIEPLVGGRYSVFTAVGLFPLMMLGIDTDTFCEGATDFLENPQDAAVSASTIYSHYIKGYLIHDIFLFSPDLAMLGNWYKQLIGESLGKKFSCEGSIVEIGITPTVSLGTVDLHSVIQLYLAGPRNRITTFVSVKEEADDLLVPDTGLTNLVQGLAGRPVTAVKRALFEGVMAAYKSEGRPFMSTVLTQKDSYSIGRWMMMKMVETILLGRLLDINPFDQPAVELYKQNARQFMS